MPDDMAGETHRRDLGVQETGRGFVFVVRGGKGSGDPGEAFVPFINTRSMARVTISFPQGFLGTCVCLGGANVIMDADCLVDGISVMDRVASDVPIIFHMEPHDGLLLGCFP